MTPLPLTPAEQQEAIADSIDALRDGDPAHNRQVLAELYRSLQRKVPLLDARIAACGGCGGAGLVGYLQEDRPGLDGLPERVTVPIECPDCHADRYELAALLGY